MSKMSTKCVEEAKQCDEANILNLPPEVLLKIFEFCVRDARDTLLLKEVCTKFLKVAQSAILHKHIIVDGDKGIHDFIPIIKYHGIAIKKLEIKNVSNEKVNEILRIVSDLNGLTSLKLKGVSLFKTDIQLIKEVVNHCKNLLSFKIVDIRDGRWDDAWLEVFDLISSRPMLEFSYPSTLPHFLINKWNINKFIKAKRDTLTSLKIPLLKGVSMTAIAKCRKLKKMHLIKGDPYSRISTNTLYSLEMLRSILIYSRRLREDNYLYKFFSRPCLIHVKSIELLGDSEFRYYVRTLRAITKNCPNLEKLKISYSLWFSPQESMAKTVLDILTSCKALKHISLPTMTLSDVLKIDKILDVGNYPQLQYFQTTIPQPTGADKYEYTNSLACGRKIFNNFNCSMVNCNYSYYCTVYYSKNIENENRNISEQSSERITEC